MFAFVPVASVVHAHLSHAKFALPALGESCIIEPAVGYLACGYEGAGRLADPTVLIAEVEQGSPAETAGPAARVRWFADTCANGSVA